jgi:hypothetical protein
LLSLAHTKTLRFIDSTLCHHNPFLFHLFSTAQKITQFGDPKSSALFRFFEILGEVQIPFMGGSAFNFGCASVTFPFPFLCFAFTKFVNESLLDELFSGR